MNTGNLATLFASKWWRKRRYQYAIATSCVVLLVVSYVLHTPDKRLKVNQHTYRPLLHLIAQVESQGNYNADALKKALVEPQKVLNAVEQISHE